MSHSSASAVVTLPFGSLTGVVPVDSVPQARVLGDFSRILGRERWATETPKPFVARPDAACTALPPSFSPSKDGGI